MKTFLKVAGLGCIGLIGLVVALLFVIGSISPETSVYTGRQIPERFIKTIRSLDLLEEGEQIRFFYSDALIDIKQGFYFVSDRNLVVYSKAWEEPKTIIPLEDIEALEAHYDDSFFTDSNVFVTTHSGLEISFPVSSDNGLDKKFVAAIEEHMATKPDSPLEAEFPATPPLEAEP